MYRKRFIQRKRKKEIIAKERYIDRQTEREGEKEKIQQKRDR